MKEIKKVKKQPRVIKLRTVITATLVIGAAIGSGLFVNYLRDQAYNTGYEQGYQQGVKKATETDKMVIERVKEIKDLMAQLK